MDLLKLADRCKKATGPDRRLDVLITIATDPDRQWIVGEKPGRWPREPVYGPLSSLWEWATDETKDPPEINAERYTASLDAAMTLVPKGWRLVIDTASEEGAALVDLWFFAATPKPTRKHAKAATPALALCAAALRAKACSDTSEEEK